MNFAKKHVVLSILILVILLSLLFILGETAVREVARYVPPASTQLAQVAGAGKFGSETLGGSSNSLTRTICGGPFAPTESGAVTSISVYGSEASGAQASAAIYSDSGSNPVTRLAVSPGTVALPATNGWTTIPISYGVTAGTNYFLCIWANGIFNNNFINNSTGNTVTGQSSTWPSWNATYSTNTNTAGRKMAIYATYTSGGSVPEEPPPPPPPPDGEDPPADPGDTTAPTISSAIQVSNITSTGATITWSTNESSDTQIEYGLSTGYGSQTTLNSNRSTTHSQTLSSLAASTVYHFRVKSKDAANNEVVSPDQTFTTGAAVVVAGSGPLWYVNKNATGANNGSSWTDAWNETNQIKWNQILPGHTIYISGGTYTSGLVPTASGASGNPITITSGWHAPDRSGHDGRVIIEGGVFTGGSDWLVFEGRKDKSVRYSSLQEMAPLTGDTVYLRDNTNIEIRNIQKNGVGGGNCILVGNSSASDPAIGVKILGLEIHHCGEPLPPQDEQQGAEILERPQLHHGIWIRNIGRETEIAYSYIHHNGGDAVNMNTGYALNGESPGYGKWSIHDNVMEKNRDDGVQIAGYLDIYNNIIRRAWFPYTRGHPDGIQNTGDYIRIYNNAIGDIANSSVFPDLKGDPAGQVIVNLRGFLVYNNIFYQTSYSKSYALNHRGVEFTFDAFPTGVKPVPGIHLDDVLIANNIFYGFTNFVALSGIGNGSNAAVSSIRFNSILIANNIFLNNRSHYAGDPSFLRNNIFYTLPGTVCHKVNSGTKNIDVNPCNQSVPAGGFTVNPFLRNPASFDFTASASSPVVDAGVSLSSWGISSRDIVGSSRPAGNAWDIGPYEFGGIGTNPASSGQVVDPVPDPQNDPSLVAHLTFDADDFAAAGTVVGGITQRYFADATTNGNKANCQASITIGGKVHNQCPISGTGIKGGKAAQFTGLGLCRMSSDYLALPRAGSLNSLNRGTIAFWVAPGEYSAVTTNILDTFTLKEPNTWMIVRDGALYYTFTVNDDSGRASDVLAFPGGTAAQGPWSHYSITWDGSKIRGYYNGVYFGEAPMTGITKLALSHYLAIGAQKHNRDRNAVDNNCSTDYGDPEGTGANSYVYPNTGFFTGKMDDIRIYNRALSAGEISSLVAGVSLPNQYVLGVSKTGGGTGSVISSPVGIGCGKRCAEAYNAGSSVTLTATESEGSTFTGWSGACSGTARTCSVSMSSAKYATANFERAGTIVASFEPESLPSNQRVGLTVSTDGLSVYQIAQASPITAGGTLSYVFNAPAGDYLIIAKVNAVSGSSNSLYVNIAANSTEASAITETMAWHMQTTAGFEERAASWGGNTSGSGNAPKVFTLPTAGNYTLVIKGREALVSIDSVIILKKGSVVVTPQNGLCSTTINQCLNGTFTDTTDTATNRLWSCVGSNGGTTASCSLPVVAQVDTSAPALSTISASSITRNSATISWTTNEPATTQIQYGLTTAYGSITPLVTTLTTSRTQTLSGLIPGTTYHYRVISKDAAGNTATSGDGVFSTAALSPVVDPLDPTPEPLVVIPLVNIPPPNVVPRTVPPVNVPIASPAETPSFISRFIPSFTSTRTTVTPSTVTKPRTTGPFVPLPEVTPEEISSAPKLSLTEQVKSIFTYILQRIQNGFLRVLGR